MLKVHTLPYNLWQENTYILSADNGDCIIIDPGCLEENEQQHLVKYIKDNDLTPKMLLNTHLHLDHVFGNRFVEETFGLKANANRADEFLLEMVVEYATSAGLNINQNPPALGAYIEDNQEIEFGDSIVKVFNIPGHSPGSIVFYCEKEGFLIAGDVLFQGAVGRADLPGGDFDILISGIKTRLLTLPSEVVVYPGHGPKTTIAYERDNNMYLV